ncbi:MAG: (d)CMP kinase, partial [Proteobacteria bacterium]|nr:(d)CMP kinase [Pseudomonadota bacterium]
GVVLDGRDIGTVVYPDADVKFFVTAAPEERARRRFEELKGNNPDVTLKKVLQDVNERDHRDSSRKISPLRAAPDAHTLDTTSLTPAAALEQALDIISAHFSVKQDPPKPSGNPGKFKPSI